MSRFTLMCTSIAVIDAIENRISNQTFVKKTLDSRSPARKVVVAAESDWLIFDIEVYNISEAGKAAKLHSTAQPPRTFGCLEDPGERALLSRHRPS